MGRKGTMEAKERKRQAAQHLSTVEARVQRQPQFNVVLSKGLVVPTWNAHTVAEHGAISVGHADDLPCFGKQHDMLRYAPAGDTPR